MHGACLTLRFAYRVEDARQDLGADIEVGVSHVGAAEDELVHGGQRHILEPKDLLCVVVRHKCTVHPAEYASINVKVQLLSTNVGAQVLIRPRQKCGTHYTLIVQSHARAFSDSCVMLQVCMTVKEYAPEQRYWQQVHASTHVDMEHQQV
jgi:hypothetical protein